jgi:hypothetical protein
MKEYFTKQKVKLSDMFTSKEKAIEAILNFFKKDSNSLAVTLMIMSLWGVALAIDTDSVWVAIADIGLIMLTWGEFFFSWKKKLDNQ